MIDYFIHGDGWAYTRIILFIVGACAFVGLNAAYLVWVERKGAAHIQRRPGPMEAGFQGLLQPIADALKLMSKQVIVPPGADALLFRLAPVLVMAPAMMCFAVIPWTPELTAASINVGLLMIFAFGSINVMAIMLGGWSSRNKYAIISAARVVSQDVAYEIPMLLTVITVIMMTGTMNLNEIVAQQQGWFWKWNLFQMHVNPLMPVTFVIFFICMLAETNRAPFDMAEAESELVAGAFTEYAGMGFGVFFMAEYANIVVGCAMATVLFLGGWGSPFAALDGTWYFAAFWFLAKMYFLIFTVVWVRWTFPRTQFYGLLNLSWKILIPTALVTLVITAVLLKFTGPSPKDATAEHLLTQPAAQVAVDALPAS
jgi:NADH-quinone oxidoreductase subunit H